MNHCTFRNLRDTLAVAAAVGTVALLLTMEAVR
jgi:hypothetical protein